MNSWITVVPKIVLSLAMGVAVRPSGKAQEFETFLVQRVIPSTRDTPAYISAVNQRVVIQGDTVYVADGSAGLAVYQLTGSSNARLIGEYKTGPNVWSVRVRGDRVYVSDQSPHGVTMLDARNRTRLRVIDPIDVSAETLAQLRQNDPDNEPGTPKAIAAIVESRLYISRQDLDVVVIALHTPPDWWPVPVQLTQPFTGTGAEFAGFVSRSMMGGTPVQAQPFIQANAPESSATYSATAPIATVEAPDQVENPELNISAEGNVLRLRITGHAGQKVRVQRSGDLIGPWTEWATGVLRDDGIDFTDLPGETQAFYRAVAE